MDKEMNIPIVDDDPAMRRTPSDITRELIWGWVGE